MSDKLMTLIDRYADLVYKSRTEPVSKYELRGYDAIRCRMDIEEALSDARSQAFEESAKIAEGFHHGYTDQGTEGLYGREAKVCSFISQAIRQHSQKGRDTE